VADDRLSLVIVEMLLDLFQRDSVVVSQESAQGGGRGIRILGRGIQLDPVAVETIRASAMAGSSSICRSGFSMAVGAKARRSRTSTGAV